MGTLPGRYPHFPAFFTFAYFLTRGEASRKPDKTGQSCPATPLWDIKNGAVFDRAVFPGSENLGVGVPGSAGGGWCTQGGAGGGSTGPGLPTLGTPPVHHRDTTVCSSRSNTSDVLPALAGAGVTTLGSLPALAGAGVTTLGRVTHHGAGVTTLGRVTHHCGTESTLGRVIPSLWHREYTGQSYSGSAGKNPGLF